MAAGYVSADYRWCGRLLTGNDFPIKLPPKPVPKIDLQEWNDMRKLMEKLQSSHSNKATQQEISLLKKQLSETTGFSKESTEVLKGQN